MEKLTLNDGTVLENSHALMVGERLFIYISSGATFAEVFELLNDPEKTKKITQDQYGEKTTFRGFKRLINVTDELNGMITAVVIK